MKSDVSVSVFSQSFSSKRWLLLLLPALSFFSPLPSFHSEMMELSSSALPSSFPPTLMSVRCRWPRRFLSEDSSASGGRGASCFKEALAASNLLFKRRIFYFLPPQKLRRLPKLPRLDPNPSKIQTCANEPARMLPNVTPQGPSAASIARLRLASARIPAACLIVQPSARCPGFTKVLAAYFTAARWEPVEALHRRGGVDPR